MNLAAEIAVVIFVGLGAFALARASRLRHVAKFGAPPPGTKIRTFGFFALLSVVYLAVGWWSPLALVGVLVGAVVLSQLVGFQNQPWSWWQQCRDGAVFANILTAPLILVIYWVAR
jgi:hypothetical protein